MDLHDLNPSETQTGKVRFWECYVEGTNGGRHYKHMSLAGAQIEAERLAKLTRKRVYLFECKGICFVDDVKWWLPQF